MIATLRTPEMMNIIITDGEVEREREERREGERESKGTTGREGEPATTTPTEEDAAACCFWKHHTSSSHMDRLIVICLSVFPSLVILF